MSDSGEGTVPSTEKGEAKAATDEKVTPKKMTDPVAKKEIGEKKSSATPAASKATPERRTKPTDPSKTEVKVKSPVKTSSSNVGTGKDKKATPKSETSGKSDKTASPSKTKSPVVPANTNLEKPTKSENSSAVVETDKTAEVSSKPTPTESTLKDEEVNEKTDSTPAVEIRPTGPTSPEKKDDLPPAAVITSTPDSQQIPRERKIETQEEMEEMKEKQVLLVLTGNIVGLLNENLIILELQCSTVYTCNQQL